MTSDKYLERPLTRVRRKDRVLDDEEWLERLLAVAATGSLAIVHDGQPMIHTNLYWYDGDRLYWHTAGTGRLRAILDTGPLRACFSVTEHGRILPANTPFDFSTEYASVTLYGVTRLVSDPVEKRHALEGLMAKYAPHLQPGIDYEPMPESDIKQTSVYCLEIETRVGKHNVKPDDYPAYHYPGRSFIEEERAAGRCTLRSKELA